MSLLDAKSERILRSRFLGLCKVASELSGERCLGETILGIRLPVTGFEGQPAEANDRGR